MGSADWMNRNIYTRIEVCFPVYDEQIKQQMIKIVNLQLADNTQAVWIDQALQNVPVETRENEMALDSQSAIYELLENESIR
jgi:polyphosphate kinase